MRDPDVFRVFVEELSDLVAHRTLLDGTISVSKMLDISHKQRTIFRGFHDRYIKISDTKVFIDDIQ